MDTISGWFTSIKDYTSDIFSSISDTFSEFFDNIFGGYLYDFVLELGDKAFGFFTPDNIGDFDFSGIILFLLGAVIIGFVLKLIQVFF